MTMDTATETLLIYSYQRRVTCNKSAPFKDHASLTARVWQISRNHLRVHTGENLSTSIKIYDDYAKYTCKDLQSKFKRRPEVKLYLAGLDAAHEIYTEEDDRRNTFLHYAAMGNCEQFVASYLANYPGHRDMKNAKGETPLLIAAKLDNFETVKELVNRNVDLNIQSRDDEKTALHYAVIRGNKRMVELLIQKRATEEMDSDGRIPLSYAAEQGLVEIASLLIQKFKMPSRDNNQMLPLHYAAKNGHAEVIRVIVESEFVLNNLNDTNDEGNNCLDLAIEGGHWETVLVLLSTTKWQELLRIHTDSNPSPFRKLILKMPDAAKEVLNRCIDIRGKDDDFEVTFNYEFLEDTPTPKDWDHRLVRPEADIYRYPDADKLCMQNHPLMIMVTEKRTELLEHPVVSALLKKKWERGIRAYLISIILSAIYVIFLMCFAMNIEPPFHSINTSPNAHSSEANATRYNITEFAEQENSTPPEANISFEDNVTHFKRPEYVKSKSSAAAISSEENVFTIVCIVVVVILAILDIIAEMVKYCCFVKVRFYFEETDHIWKLVSCIASFFFVIGLDAEYRPVWQWSFGIISILLAWISVFLQLQKFEIFGMYLIMVKQIVEEFIKFFIIVCVPLVVMFTFCFYLLFQNQKEFGTMWTSLVKTTAMMIGEVNLNVILFGKEMHSDVISFFTIFVFLVFMTLVVVNITIGLAVDKIQKFRSKAGTTKKEMQVKFVFALEKGEIPLALLLPLMANICSKCCSECCKSECFHPNKQCCLKKWISRSWNLTEKAIVTALNSTQVQVSKADDTMLKKISTMESTLMTQTDDMEKLESNLKTQVESVEKTLKFQLTKEVRAIKHKLDDIIKKLEGQEKHRRRASV